MKPLRLPLSLLARLQEMMARLRPARTSQPMTVSGEDNTQLLSLRNLIVATAVLLVLLVIWQAASPRVAVLALAFGVMGGLLWVESRRRRRWEETLNAKVTALSDDNLRLMRDIARQRQETIFIREALAGAGAAMRRQQDKADSVDSVEHRMLHTISGVLAGLAGGPARPEAEDAMPVSGALDLAIIEHHAQSGAQSPSLTDAQVVQLVRTAIDQDRIDLFVQPVVTLPQRKPRFVEAFSRIRIRKDVYMPAERYVAAARRHDMLPAIDNLLLLRTLQALRKAAASDPVRVFFCNITSLTLHDPKFMTDLVEFIAQYREMAPRLVFEMSQHDLETLRHDVLPVLAGLSHLGCRFSMDQVRTLNISAEGLAARFIRFVKVETGLLLEALHQANGRAQLQQFKAALDMEGIDLIVEKVETEKQLVEILDIGIDYGQGYLFGQPLVEGTGEAA